MFDRITEQLRLRGTYSSQLVTYSSFPRTMSRQHLTISKDGDTTASLGNLFQSMLGHPHGKKSFLTFRGNLLYFCLCPLLLVLPLGTTE